MARSRAVFTTRGSGALLGALLVFLLAFYTTNIVLFVVAVFLLGFVLAGLLSFTYSTRGFRAEAFAVDRVECSSLVGVGGAGMVSLRLTSRLPGSFYAELFDAHSERLKVLEGDDRLITWCARGEPISLAYVVSPDLRGLFQVGPTVVVAHDPLGLAFKTVQVDSRWPIEAIVQPPSLPLGHPVRLPSTVVGQTSLSARGSGSDFRGLREYEAHDELRNIAWTRSGQGTLFVREYERESQQDLVVLLDVGRGMATGSSYDNALEKSVEAAARVLRLAFDEGGRGGLLMFDRTVLSYVAPGRGSNHEFRVFRALTAAQVQPPLSSLAAALGYLQPRLERSTSVLAFSSPADEPLALSTEAAGLRHQGHRLYALVPDLERMYDALPAATDQTAFELLMAPELRLSRRTADALERAGAPVVFFGRGGAVEAVAQIYARQRRSPGFG